MQRHDGAALVVVLLLVSALTLLGLAAAWQVTLARRIGRMEHAARQAQLVAEGAVDVVAHWFDRPRSDRTGVPFPEPWQVDRGLRRIVEARTPDIGPRIATSDERYKRGIDRDGDGHDDLFDKPYRGDLRDRFVGTVDGPDVRIVDRAFLATLNRALQGSSAAVPGSPTLVRIDIYGAPLVAVARGRARAGLATVHAVARVDLPGGGRIEQSATAVLGEIPYDGSPPRRGLDGPLQVCGRIAMSRAHPAPPGVHWGAISATGSIDLGTGAILPRGLPRGIGGPADPTLWAPGFRASFTRYRDRVPLGTDLGDPWFRLVAGGVIRGLPPGLQTSPSPWSRWDGLTAPPGPWVDHSNVTPRAPVRCPDHPYADWKSIARSEGPELRYFAWAHDDRFREDGRGPALPFRQLTHEGRGVYFFDTTDGDAPTADGGNLTPAIEVAGGRWSFSGLLYVNARQLDLSDVIGTPRAMTPPGEPFVDLDSDGQFDGPTSDDEPWIDVDYPDELHGGFRARAPDAIRRDRGPAALVAEVNLRGVLVLAGRLRASGGSRHYGAVVAHGGAVLTDAGIGRSPLFYWDSTLGPDWPSPDLTLPRVVITGRAP